MLSKKNTLKILIIVIFLINIRNINADENNYTKGEYGYFIDEYKNNTLYNQTPQNNPTIGVLSQFLNIWIPTNNSEGGVKINEEILDENIRKSIEITNRLSTKEKKEAYITDRISQRYQAIDGLEEYSKKFKMKANAGTTITEEIPIDAKDKVYIDLGNTANLNMRGHWADTNKYYSNIVKLINKLNQKESSTAQSKQYYNYKRPFRWSQEVKVVEELIPTIRQNSAGKYSCGFPSGHTNSAYVSSLGLAYSVPEKYNDLLMNASKMSNSRINAGVHSPLDVMGGRVLATALTASILNDNEELIEKAYMDGRELTKGNVDKESIETKIEKYKKNKPIYDYRLTYGFKKKEEIEKEASVPKGAEILIETRYPYMDKNQLRRVLESTVLESGYPLLDDKEGWGRINLFEAVNGYGEFKKDTYVNMNANKGGFNLEDAWLNDIEGSGKLIKEGSGKLIIAGNNSFTGGTEIEEGEIEIYSQKALGNGYVINKSILSENINGNIEINDDFIQTSQGILKLNIKDENDILKINGDAKLNGKLEIRIDKKYSLKDSMKIIDYKKLNKSSKFKVIKIIDNGKYSSAEIIYKSDGVYIKK